MHQFWCRNECFPFRLFGLKTYVWFENIYNKRDMNGAVKNRMKSVWFLRSSLTCVVQSIAIFNAKTKPLSSQRIDVFRRTNRFILMRYFITKCTNISKLTEFLLLQSLISFLLYHSTLPHVALFVVVYDTFQTF
jgi:hypothetical protein